MEGNNKRKLLGSAALVTVSLALLVGLTFAWFTDSVKSTGNSITAGTLGITAKVAGYKADGVNSVDASSLENADALPDTLKFDQLADVEGDNIKIINDANWEPGQSNAKLIEVSNSGTLAAKLKLEFSATDGSLQDALWYDFIQVKNGKAVGQFTERPMNTLNDLGKAQEFTIKAGKDLQFMLVYGMKTSAGNEYMGKTFTADVTILATQAPVEKDGFGSSDYDKAVSFNIEATDANSFEKAVANLADGGTVTLGNSITTNRNLTINGSDVTSVIDLNGKTFTTTNGDGFGFVLRNGNATIRNGQMSTSSSNGAYGVIATSGGESLTLEDLTIYNYKANGVAVDIRSATKTTLNDVTIVSQLGGGFTTCGTADLYNCTMTQTGNHNWNSNNVSVSNGGTVNVHSGSYTSDNFGLYVYNSGGTINVNGGTFKADTVLKADKSTTDSPSVIHVSGGTLDGKFSIAAQAALNIEGGTFSNTGLTLEQFKAYVAEGHEVTESNGTFTVA